MLEKYIALLLPALIVLSVPCGAMENAKNIRVTVNSRDALLYETEEEVTVPGTVSVQDLAGEEARSIYSSLEEADTGGSRKDVRVRTYLDREKLETDRGAWDYLTGISHDILSLMLYENTDRYTVFPENFVWTVSGEEEAEGSSVKASLSIVMPEYGEPENNDARTVFGENLDAAVSDILENSDYNLNGKTDTQELIRGVYEKTRALLVPEDTETENTAPDRARDVFLSGEEHSGDSFMYASTAKALCNRLGIGCMVVTTAGGEVKKYANALQAGNGTYLMDAFSDDLEQKNTEEKPFLLHEEESAFPSGSTFFGYLTGGTVTRDIRVAGFPNVGVKLSETPFEYDYAHHHAYSEAMVEPTCTTDGYIEGICACGDRIRRGIRKAAGHDLTVVEEKKASCTEKGYVKSRCGVCGEEVIEILPALGHERKKTVKEPTCTQPGSVTVSCARCGTVFSEEETAPLGHDFSGEVTEKNATCLSSGYIERTCRRCGEKERTETSGPAEHDFRAEETDPPTCTEEGCTFYVCTRCGKILKDDIIPATGHDYITETVEASCTQNGYTRHTCTKCGDVYNTDQISAYGHDWQIIEAVDATDTQDGHILKRCANCGEEKTTVIPKKEPETTP